MSVVAYNLRVLEKKDFPILYDIPYVLRVLEAWRHKYSFASKCTECRRTLSYERQNFQICCQRFHLNPTDNYLVRSLAVRTPRVHLLPVFLRNKLPRIDQDFLTLPDPIYWQLDATLTYSSALKTLLNSDDLVEKHRPAEASTEKKLSKRGSFHEATPQLDVKFTRLYNRVQNAPLYHRSLTQRSQGKESLYRKIAIAKRAEKMARSMIVPEPRLKPNEIVLPEAMSMLLGKWVIINRMPSLAPENFVALKVVQTWSLEAAGLPAEILQHLGADFDGDEINVIQLFSHAAQAECELLLNSEKNMHSFCNGLKLYPSQDAIIAHYLKPPLDGKLDLPKFLKLVYELEGSGSCFSWFDYFRRHYLHVLENEIVFAVSLKEFHYLKRVAEETDYSFEEFEKRILRSEAEDNEEIGCLQTQVNSGAKGTPYHLFQLIGSVGLQKLDDRFETIRSSFWDGLQPEEYIVHAKSGHDALINSALMVWKPGYLSFKLVNCTQNITVDYEGKLVDGDLVLYDDALEDCFHEDLISNETFDFVFDSHFPSKKLKTSARQ